MKRPIIALSVAITAAALAAACTTAKMTFVFKDASYQKQPRKVLVLAAVRKTVPRRVVTDEFVRRFKDRGIEAVRGYAVFPGDDLPAQEAVAREVTAGGYDALLLMRLVDPRSEVPGARGPAADPQSQGWAAHYRYCYTTAYSPDYTVEDKYALAETSLYDAATEKLIWTASSETWLGSENIQRMIQDYTDLMMGSLQMYKLVPPAEKK